MAHLKAVHIQIFNFYRKITSSQIYMFAVLEHKYLLLYSHNCSTCVST